MLNMKTVVLFAALFVLAPSTGPMSHPALAASGSVDKAAVVVSMSPRRAKVRLGRRVVIQVRIANASNLGHAPFHVSFDPRVLRFETGREGLFMKSGGAQTAFFAEHASGEGEIVIGLSRLGRGEGASGSGTLCTLEFTAVGRGDALLQFRRASTRDADDTVVPSLFAAASVTVR